MGLKGHYALVSHTIHTHHQPFCFKITRTAVGLLGVVLCHNQISGSHWTPVVVICRTITIPYMLSLELLARNPLPIPSLGIGLIFPRTTSKDRQARAMALFLYFTLNRGSLRSLPKFCQIKTKLTLKICLFRNGWKMLPDAARRNQTQPDATRLCQTLSDATRRYQK